MSSAGPTGPWTIKSLVMTATDHLRERGIESPRLDVELLLAHVLGCPRLDLWLRFDMPVDDADRARFRELFRRRRDGVPVAYLLGEREFYGRPFTVDPRCLVPRPETEHLIDRALVRLRADGAATAPRVADVGTGSGCIAVTLAAEIPALLVDAIDISEGALEIARVNAARHGVADRVRFLHGDLLDPVSDVPPYDLICSNPPYILDSERRSLPVDVRDHEPALALFSGEDGLAFHKRLLLASERLVDGGLLLMELPDGGDAALRAFVETITDAPMIALETERDLAGIPRIFAAEKRRRP